jgi:hypothetical protein
VSYASIVAQMPSKSFSDRVKLRKWYVHTNHVCVYLEFVLILDVVFQRQSVLVSHPGLRSRDAQVESVCDVELIRKDLYIL